MTGYLAKRLILAIPVFLGISLVVFLSLRLVPGDPALALAGMDADADTVAAIREEYGLERPIHIQYVEFMSHLARLDLGRSISTKEPVVSKLAEALPVTLALAVAATILATTVGISLGILAARFQRSPIDYSVMILAMGGVSIPNYALGLVLILAFSVALGWLPATGAQTPVHFVLPVVTIAAASGGVIARQTRAAMLEVLDDDYIRTARAKGLAERSVMLRHALRNALIPVVTTIGLIFGQLLAGTTIVEKVFAIPGLGTLMVDGVSYRDYPVVQGAVLLIASMYVLVNIVVDLAYVAIDSRSRTW